MKVLFENWKWNYRITSFQPPFNFLCAYGASTLLFYMQYNFWIQELAGSNLHTVRSIKSSYEAPKHYGFLNKDCSIVMEFFKVKRFQNRLDGNPSFQILELWCSDTKLLSRTALPRSFKVQLFLRRPQTFGVIFHLIWCLLSKCQIKWGITPNFCSLLIKAELYSGVVQSTALIWFAPLTHW